MYAYKPGTFHPLSVAKRAGYGAAAAVYRYHVDHLGTPQELTAEDGRVAWRARYRAWGAVQREAVREVAQPLRFPGQYADAETGLHYNRHRYYSPAEGRFVSQDPIRLKGGENLATYVPNPITWLDPFGLSCSRITPGSLPAEEEAAVTRILGHVDNGTVPTGATKKKWGVQFKNWDNDLPGASGPSSPYREYRVDPAPGSPTPGPRRVVTDNSTGEVYYTWTHYGDAGPPAFVRIR